MKTSEFFSKLKKVRKNCHFQTFLPFHSSAPEGFLRMSPGFIMSAGVQAIRYTCAKLYYLGTAKVFSSIATDFGPDTKCISMHFYGSNLGPPGVGPS